MMRGTARAVAVVGAVVAVTFSTPLPAASSPRPDGLDHDRGTVYTSPFTAQPSARRHVTPCATDEGADGQGIRPCVWDAIHQGNGSGRSFIVRKSGRVQYLTHSTAHKLTH